MTEERSVEQRWLVRYKDGTETDGFTKAEAHAAVANGAWRNEDPTNPAVEVVEQWRYKPSGWRTGPVPAPVDDASTVAVARFLRTAVVAVVVLLLGVILLALAVAWAQDRHDQRQTRIGVNCVLNGGTWTRDGLCLVDGSNGFSVMLP